MKMIFFFLFFPFFLVAQNGYRQWLAVQGTEMHLLGDYKEKKVYESKTGDKDDLKLLQVQTFVKGRLLRDIMYEDYPSKLMFDMLMEYSDVETAVGTNLLDSSQVTYSFTKDKKIRYYVIDKQSATHVIYTYDEDGLLIRCKDCLDPYEGQHEWCVYHVYSYNKGKQLEAVASYNLQKGQPVDTKVLFARDSLVYENALLTIRLAISIDDGGIVEKVTYSYNKKKQLEKESFEQSEVFFLEPRRYTKRYNYYCNNKTKTIIETYYRKKVLQGTQIITYDKKGRKTKQESIRADGKRTKLYEMKYKN